MRRRTTTEQGMGRGRTARPPLTVRRSPTGYVVHDPALARLAGFESVPLPFTPEATPDEVLAHLRRLNPHREVRYERPPHPSSPASGASDIPHPSCA